jgi:hypothetical protein
MLLIRAQLEVRQISYYNTFLTIIEMQSQKKLTIAKPPIVQSHQNVNLEKNQLNKIDFKFGNSDCSKPSRSLPWKVNKAKCKSLVHQLPVIPF